jgi:hypothetical protein
MSRFFTEQGSMQGWTVAVRTAASCGGGSVAHVKTTASALGT